MLEHHGHSYAHDGSEEYDEFDEDFHDEELFEDEMWSSDEDHYERYPEADYYDGQGYHRDHQGTARKRSRHEHDDGHYHGHKTPMAQSSLPARVSSKVD